MSTWLQGWVFAIRLDLKQVWGSGWEAVTMECVPLHFPLPSWHPLGASPHKGGVTSILPRCLFTDVYKYLVCAWPCASLGAWRQMSPSFFLRGAHSPHVAPKPGVSAPAAEAPQPNPPSFWGRRDVQGLGAGGGGCGSAAGWAD